MLYNVYLLLSPQKLSFVEPCVAVGTDPWLAVDIIRFLFLVHRIQPARPNLV